ncbi:hypothetical protein OG936_23910 [Streptomyces sp. NBC_00846]|uniref:hypothetical protein n=1 Tax=Streptomyces sp. NBC_00846 TaxID=2975849 RepID=UPI003864B695|nr:hypothetical protein OG936_23910 [Streptomyces sp. NBC_00846]
MTNRTVPVGTPASAIGDRLRTALPVEQLGATGFPGRRAGGTAMVLGLLLMTAGALLRGGGVGPDLVSQTSPK